MSVGTAIRNPRTFVVGKWSTFKTILFDPERFHEELSASDRLWTEILVVILVGAAGTVGSYFMARTIMSNFYTGSAPIEGSDAEWGISGDVGIQIWGYSLRGIVGALVLWLFLAVALYVVSWLYSNRGSFFGLLKHTAWSLVPLFIGNLIKSVAFVIASWNAWDSGTLEVTDGDLINSAEEVRAFLYGQILDEPAAIVGTLVGALFIFWTAYIAAYGVSEVRDIPVEDAYKVAAVPAVLYLLYIVYQVLGLTGVLG